MVICDLEFEWDESKESLNIKKHGVNFTEAVDSFFDPNGIQLFDTAHSTNKEKRYYWVGKTKAGRILTTYFTKRRGKIRIIGSAQWRKFRRYYHEATQNK
ncbi:MAG: BrnT family toxin [Pseudomonadota bacterium]